MTRDEVQVVSDEHVEFHPDRVRTKLLSAAVAKLVSRDDCFIPTISTPLPGNTRGSLGTGGSTASDRGARKASTIGFAFEYSVQEVIDSCAI